MVVLDYLQAEMNHQEWKYVEVRPINGAISRKTMEFEFHPAAFYFLHRLNLHPKLNEIFKGLHKDSVQRRIRRAERAGLVEKCDRSNDLFKPFYDLLVLTRKRHHLPPHQMLGSVTS